MRSSPFLTGRSHVCFRFPELKVRLIVPRSLMLPLILILLSESSLIAQNYWTQPTHQFNGNIQSLLVLNSGDILAGTETGSIYRSTDHGNTWTQDSARLPYNYRGSIQAMAQTKTGYIYVGTKTPGIYVSSDGGNTWRRKDSTSTLVVTDILSICVDSSGNVYSGSSSGVWRSTDNGSTWTALGPNISANVYCLVANKAGNIMAGTNFGIYVSSDSGNTWTLSTQGLPSNTTVYSLSSNASGEVFAGTDIGVFVSIDHGNSWAQTGLNGSIIKTIAITPSGTIFAGTTTNGVFVSANDGLSWTQTSLSSAGISSVTCDSSGAIIAGASNQGTYVSLNNGSNWVKSNSILFPLNMYSLVSELPNKILVGTDNGVYTSDNMGVTWSQLGTLGFPATSLTLAPNGYVFAGGYRSQNYGYSWTQMSVYGSKLVDCFDNENHSLYVGSSNGGLYVSADYGSSFTKLSVSGVVYSIAVDSVGDIFVGTSSGVYVSTDNGVRWALTFPGTYVYSFYCDDSSNVYAGSDGGAIYKSSDVGSTWSKFIISNTAGTVTSITGNSTGALFAGLNAGSENMGGVFESTDGGFTWQAIVSGLTNRFVQCLSVSSNAYLYCGTDADSGPYYQDYGEMSSTWVVRSAIQTAPVISIPIDSVSFGPIQTGDSLTKQIVVADSSQDTLRISSLTLSSKSFQAIASTPAMVPPGGYLKIPVLFRPDSFGTFRDTLRINSNGGDTRVYLQGQSPQPFLTIAPSTLSFGDVAKDTTKVLGVSLRNSSINALRLDSVYTKTSWFTISADSAKVIDSMMIHVSFHPDSVMSYIDTLYILSNSQTSLVKIPLSGICPAGRLLLGNSSLTYGSVPIGDSLGNILAIKDSSVTGITIKAISTKLQSFHTNVALPFTINGNDSIGLNVWFVPSGYGGFVDTMTIQSNGGTAHIPLSGSSPYPTAILSKTSASFSSSVIGTTYHDSLSIKDTTINKLTIDSAYTRTKWFTASLSKDTCGLNDSLFARVTFTPDSATSYTDTLYLVNNSMTPLVKIPLSGNVPAPVLSVPAAAVMLPQAATTDSSSLDVTIHDPSINPLTVSSLSLMTNAFHIRTALPLTVQGKDSAKVHIVFLPGSFGTFNDTLSIVSNGGTAHIPLSSSSPYPIALISHQSIDYGMVPLGTGQTQNVVVRDSSINALSIDTIYTKTKEYKVSLSRGTVNPADSLTISMTFTPDTTGDFNDTLYIRNNSQTPLYRLPLSGSSPMPEIAVANVLSAFTAKAGQSGTQSVRFTNSSINVLVLDSAKTMTKYFKVTTTFPDTVIKGDTASVEISFLPDSVQSYTDTLYVYSNAGSPTVIALNGTGSTPTGILREGSAIPTVYELYQNYPNPFNPTTTIKFALPTQSQVSVTIYDILGREVKDLVNDRLQAGYYHFSWNASRYASGVYFYRIVAQSLTGDRKSFVQVKKLMLVK